MNTCAGIGHYAVATINKMQLDHSIDGMIQGEKIGIGEVKIISAGNWIRRELCNICMKESLLLKKLCYSFSYLPYKVCKTVQDY
jgi:hypothetical protein